MDDFKNVCGCEEYPLLRTINRVLRKYPGPHNTCVLENRKAINPQADPTRKPVTTAMTTTTRRPPVTKTKMTEKPVAKPTRTTERVETSTRPRKTTIATKTPMINDEYPDLPDLDDEFSCVEGRPFVQHKTDCRMYYQCDNGRPIERV